MNSVEFTVLWTDYEGMFKLAVKASCPTHATYHETYMYPEELEAFAAELKEFPRAAAPEVVLESGAKDPQVYDYFRLRVFLLKPLGLSALEVESEVREHLPDRAEVHFFIPGMPADFNRMGSKLIGWLKDTSAPLVVEWKLD